MISRRSSGRPGDFREQIPKRLRRNASAVGAIGEKKRGFRVKFFFSFFLSFFIFYSSFYSHLLPGFLRFYRRLQEIGATASAERKGASVAPQSDGFLAAGWTLVLERGRQIRRVSRARICRDKVSFAVRICVGEIRK